VKHSLSSLQYNNAIGTSRWESGAPAHRGKVPGPEAGFSDFLRSSIAGPYPSSVVSGKGFKRIRIYTESVKAGLKHFKTPPDLGILRQQTLRSALHDRGLSQRRIEDMNVE
jgi:hypothetical protein